MSISESNFILENHQGSVILNPNEDILLLFNDNVLENDDEMQNSNFYLEAPYPNPFNPIVNFNLHVLENDYINITIYDIKGNKINNIFDGFLSKGAHNFYWDAHNYSTGTYMIKCQSKKISLIQKIFLIK